MTIRHLLIFLIANCSVFTAGASNSSKTLLEKGETSPINCQFQTIESFSRANKGATHHLSIQTHTKEDVSRVLYNIDIIFGNYLFDVDVEVKSGEYEKYVLADDKSTKIEMKKEIERIQCTSCAWV